MFVLASIVDEGEAMQFQVLGSTIRYRHPLTSKSRGVALEFDVFPSELGELKFSDGSRLMGCDLSENLGEPLTIGLLSKKLRGLGYEDIDENRFRPLSVTVSVTDDDWKAVEFLKGEEFACGYARYQNDDYAHGLQFWVSVTKEVFRDLLQVRLNLPGRMTLDLGVRGLADQDRCDPDSLDAIWDLADKSDCGEGYYRVVTGFSLGRETRHFFNDPQTERVEAARAEDKREMEKLRSLLTDIVAIENGTVDGAVPKLLRLNLLASSVIAVLGIFALVRLFF